MKSKKKQILILSLALLLVGIGIICYIFFINNDKYISLDTYSISKSHYTYFCTQGYDQAYALLGVSGSELWESDIEGVEAEKWMKDYAEHLCKRYLAINKMFDDLNLTLDDDDLSEIEDTVYDEWNYTGRLAIYGPMGIDEDTYTDIITAEKKAERITDYYSDDLDKNISESDIKTYLSENYVSFVYVAMSYYDESGESATEQYEALCKEIEDGKTVEDLALELNELDTNLILTSISDERERLDYAVINSGSSFPTQFIKDLLDVEIGDTVYFDDTANMVYSISKRTEILSDDYYLETYRDEIISALRTEAFEYKLDSEIEDYDIKVDTWSVNRFNIKELY